MLIKRQALFWAVLFLATVGFALHIHQMFVMAATLACLPGIARLLGRRQLEGLCLRRQAPASARCGEQITITLRVRNESRGRRLFFSVMEKVPPTLANVPEYEFPVAILEPGEEASLPYTLPARRRGVYQLGPANLLSKDLLGLHEYRRVLPERNQLIIYPQPVPAPYLWPPTPAGPIPQRARQRRRDVGDDFYGLRDYLPGDDARRIHWKISARRRKLTIVEYEPPEAFAGIIILDAEARWHAGEGKRQTIEDAVTLAATLMEQAFARGGRVGLLANSSPPLRYPPAAAAEQRQRLYEALARVQADGQQPLAHFLRENLGPLPAGVACAVLSPSPEAVSAVHLLCRRGHPVVWLLLDAGSYRAAPPQWAREDEALLTAFREEQCLLYVIRGDQPLAGNWPDRLATQEESVNVEP